MTPPVRETHTCRPARRIQEQGAWRSDHDDRSSRTTSMVALEQAAARHLERLQRGAGAGLPHSLERLMSAAWKLLEREGGPDIKIESLLRESGISRRVFYHHLDSKAELVAMMLRHKRDKVAYDVLRAIADAPTPLQRVGGWVSAVLDGMLDPAEYQFQRLIRANRAELAALPNAVDRGGVIILGPLDAALQDGLADGTFQITDPLRTAQGIWMLCLGAMSDWRFDDLPSGADAIREVVTNSARDLLHLAPDAATGR